jgi:hypothetical protein
MKLTHIALAALALAAGNAAFAATERLTGASASEINVVRGLKNLCGANTFAVYKQTSSLSSLGNIITVTCSANFGTTSVDQVRVNVSGGSLGAVTGTTGQTGAVGVAMIDPAAATCTPATGAGSLAAGTGPLSFLAAGELRNCASTGTSLETGNGGFMDVDGTIFRASGLAIPATVTDTSDYIASNFYQAFAVGVSNSLYLALQAYQVAQGLMPAVSSAAQGSVTCATVAGTVYTGTGATVPDCQPSLSRAQIAGFVVSGGAVKTIGANALIGGTTTLKNDLSGKSITPTQDVALKSKLTYCRRPNTSGTQASVQMYFLNSPIGAGEVGGALGVVGSSTAPAVVLTGTTFAADTGSGTSDAKTCLNAAGYAFGIVSAENNPLAGSDTYRFVKLNGVSVTEGTSTASNTVESIAGRYDFVYNSAMFCPGGTCATILTELNKSTTIVAGQSSPGLYLLSEAKFIRTQGKSSRPLVFK